MNITKELVRKLNELPERDKQNAIDAMTTAEAVQVFNLALELATEDWGGNVGQRGF